MSGVQPCRGPALAPLYDAYSFRLLPELGQMVAGDREAYAYLVESIRKFPDQRRSPGVWPGRFRPDQLAEPSGGIAAIHSGWRL